MPIESHVKLTDFQWFQRGALFSPKLGVLSFDMEMAFFIQIWVQPCEPMSSGFLKDLKLAPICPKCKTLGGSFYNIFYKLKVIFQVINLNN